MGRMVAGHEAIQRHLVPISEYPTMSDQPTCSETSTRRNVLLCAALAGSAGLGLTACSAGGSGGSGSSASSAPNGPVDLGAASEVPVGGGKVFRNDQVIVTQPTKGEYKAFSAICTHAGCTVEGVVKGVILCPCHGSMYNPSTGAVVGGPAPSPLAALGLQVQGGKLLATPAS